nr:MAG TPA: hypothetical protein [Caudoviricetes sp.]
MLPYLSLYLLAQILLLVLHVSIMAPPDTLRGLK